MFFYPSVREHVLNRNSEKGRLDFQAAVALTGTSGAQTPSTQTTVKRIHNPVFTLTLPKKKKRLTGQERQGRSLVRSGDRDL